jgi:hypothetical protein
MAIETEMRKNKEQKDVRRELEQKITWRRKNNEREVKTTEKNRRKLKNAGGGEEKEGGNVG